MAQGEGQIAKFFCQLFRLVGVVEVGVSGVGEPAAQIGSCLVPRVEAEPDQGPALAAELGILAPGGGQDPAVTRTAVRPPFLKGSRVGEVVEHHEPPSPRGRQPPHEQPRRPAFVLLVGPGKMQLPGCFRVRGDDLVGAGGSRPHQYVQTGIRGVLLVPQLPCQGCRQLAFAHSARAGQHHVTTLAPRLIGLVPYRRTRLERRGEPRDVPHPHRPLHGRAGHRRPVHVHVPRRLYDVPLCPCLLTRTALPWSLHHCRPLRPGPRRPGRRHRRRVPSGGCSPASADARSCRPHCGFLRSA